MRIVEEFQMLDWKTEEGFETDSSKLHVDELHSILPLEEDGR